MSQFSFDNEGSIVGGMPMPSFLHDKLTEEELVEVRKFAFDRFSMGGWYREETT